MPTYGYQCTECKYEFSVFQSMKDDPVATCPQCSGKVKRLLYPVGIVFKGTGWYINDSRAPEKTAQSGDTEKSDKAEKSDTTAAPSTESSGETKSTAPAKEAKSESAASPAAPASTTK